MSLDRHSLTRKRRAAPSPLGPRGGRAPRGGVLGAHFGQTLAWLALCGGLVCTSALAAAKTEDAEALARYQLERAVCLSGQSNQDRATCLREAGAALAEARRGELGDAPAKHAGNASKRCERLPDADRMDCLARMQGQGTTSGSVAGGGIYRELVTREPTSSGAAKAASGVPAVPAK